jgi:hypothetical protein
VSCAQRFRRPSLKAALDIDWADADQKHHALQRWCDELDALPGWIGIHLPQERQSPPLTAQVIPITPGKTAGFPAAACEACALRSGVSVRRAKPGAEP